MKLSGISNCIAYLLHDCTSCIRTEVEKLQQLQPVQDLQSGTCALQGVFTSLYGGVGGGLGGLFGGFIYSTYGAAAVFQIGLLVIVAGWIACTVCQLVAGCVCTPTT